MSYIELLNETLTITSPIFMLVFLGWALMRIGWLSSHFVNSASNLIFTLFLPLLIFKAILGMDVKQDMNWGLVLYAWLFSLISFIAAWLFLLIAPWRNTDPTQKGVFVQGAFRSNLGIIGIALCINSYGDLGIGQAALLLAMVTPLFNVLSVIVLSYYQGDGGAIRTFEILKAIAKNPLIIAIIIALPLSYWQLKLPFWLDQPLASISDMTLPLALLCIGGALNLKAMKSASLISLSATMLKLVVFPFCAALGAVIMGWDAITVGIIFLMFASPTAAASFVMAKAMKGDGTMAANIIAMTTVASAFTVSAGLFMLKTFGWA